MATINGQRFKRVVLADSHWASRIAANLREFAEDRIYPELLFERERELWLEYVEGTPVDCFDEGLLEQLAALLAILHRRRPRRQPAAPFLQALLGDLRFLGRVGVLGASRLQTLQTLAERIAPQEVWVGYDCSDAILKNFVVERGGRLRAVDVESLAADELLGSGAAKAGVRWLGDRRDHFLALLDREGVPGFGDYMPFVELCFLAFWQKSCFLEKKRRFVDPALFDPLIARCV